MKKVKKKKIEKGIKIAVLVMLVLLFYTSFWKDLILWEKIVWFTGGLALTLGLFRK